MAPPPGNPYHGARLAGWAGLACPPAAAALLLAAGRLTPGYDAVRTTVSHLGQRGQPYALAVNLAFAALGLTAIAVALALDRSLRARGRAGWPLVLAGLALVGVAFVSRDPVRPVPHRVVALVLFLALLLAPAVAARCLRRDPAWVAFSAPSLAAAALSLALLLAGAAGVVHGGLPAGAWERTFVGVDLLWLMAVSAGLLRARTSLPHGAGTFPPPQGGREGG